MKHFKITLEIDNGSSCRKLYVKRLDIIQALEVSKKIRASKLLSIVTISYAEYMKGVSLKYSKSK